MRLFVQPPPLVKVAPLLGRFAVLLVIVALAQSVLAADNPQSIRRHYDIAALPLDIALSRFSEISGIDVLLREPNVTQRKSSPVRGQMTAAEALRVLLDGSGLIARFTSASSAIIVPAERANEPWIAPTEQAGSGSALLSLDMMHVTAPRLIESARTGADEKAFAQRLVAVIRRLIIDEAVFDGGKPVDLRIATGVTPEGALHNVQIVKGSRNRAADRRVITLLEGAQLGLAPPKSLRQPLLFDVSGR